MATKRRSPIYPVPALEKGLDILEHLASADGPQAPAALASALGRTRNELFRLLSCLERRGYIVRDEAGHCRLSLRLFELSHRVPPITLLLRLAERPLQDIARRIEQSVHLSVISQGRLLVLAEAASPQKVRVSVPVGVTFPVLTTISGRLLLAQQPPDERERFLAGDADYAALGTSERARLAIQLDRLARDRHGSADDESHRGLRDVAVICGSQSVGVLAAIASPRLLSAGTPAEESERALQIMQREAAAITAGLGVRAT